MKKPITPCFKCEDRVVGCHISCEKYHTYADEVTKWRDAKYEQKDKERQAYTKMTDTEFKRRNRK